MAINIADTKITITADLSAYTKSLKEAETQAKGLGPTLKTALTADVPALVRGLATGKAGMAEIRAEAVLLGGALKTSLGTGLTNVFNGGINVIKKGLSGLRGFVGDIFKGFALGIGAFGLTALVEKAVQFIPNLVSQGREYGQIVADVQQATGATAEQASELVGTLSLMGAPLNNITQLLFQFQRNLSTPAVQKALKEIGVSIYETNGNLKQTPALIEEIRRAWEKFGISTEVVAASQRALGRGGAKVWDDWLRMSSADMDKLKAKVHEMGLVVTADQAQLAENMKWSGKQMELAWTGVGVALYEAFGPQLNALLSAAADFISSNRDTIVNAITEIGSTIIAFIATLVGAQSAIGGFFDTLQTTVVSVTPTQANLNSINVQISELDKNLNGVVDTEEKAGSAATAASNAASKAIDKQIEKVRALEAAQQRAYKKALDGLNAQLDAQLRLMDAADQALDRERRDEDLKRGLREAQLELAKAMAAQQAKPSDQGLVDIEKAQQAVLDAQRAISDEARNRAQDDRRAQIQAVKDFITEIDRLVSDAATSQSAAKEDLATLMAREKELRAAGAGGAAPSSDQAIELKAVLEAEKRVRQAAANDTKQAALESTKEALAAQTSAVRSAVKSQTQITLDGLRERQKALEKTRAEEIKADAERQKRLRRYGELIGGSDPQGLPANIERARQAGIKFANDMLDAFLGPGRDGKGGIVGAIASIAKGFADLARLLGDPAMKIGLAALVGAAIGGPQGAAAFAAVAAISLNKGAQPGEDVTNLADILGGTAGDPLNAQEAAKKAAGLAWYDKSGRYHPGTKDPFHVAPTKPPGTITGSSGILKPGQGIASGGRTTSGWNLVGEQGPELIFSGGNEFVLSNAASRALARLNALAPAMVPAVASVSSVAGPTPIIRVEIGGNRLLDYIDRNLAYRRR